MMERYPLKLSNVTKSPIWGGKRLLTDWGKESVAETVGESWELTVRREEKSMILNGVYAGRSLESLFEEFGWDLIAPNYEGREFPLLVKLIDACDALSVQVHPDDDYAGRVENDRGKTEMWYIVEADEGAELIFGLQDGATQADFARAVRENDCERALKRCPVRAGECYFIPAGMTHAIGKGILIAEIQQNCDLTYRVYDYNRRGADGSLRELHVEKALEVVKPFTDAEIEAVRYSRQSESLANGETLADCAYFRVERWVVDGNATMPDCVSMRHVLCLSGEGSFVRDGVSYPIKKGDSYFLPAMDGLSAEGSFTALVSGI